MGQLDWGEVLAIESTSLQDDEAKAERMFSILAEVGSLSNLCLVIEL